jgi:hypothetical protein
MSTFQPLTPELLRQLESEDTKTLWLKTRYAAIPVIGVYEWRQGHEPDGFNTWALGRIGAKNVSHVAEVVTPSMPDENPAKGSWEAVFGHLGTPDEAGNEWHRIKDENDKLRAFAQSLFEHWPQACGVDGFGLQDLAEKHGLMAKRDPAPTVPCSEICACVEYYPASEFEAGGVICYVRTPLLTGEPETKN